MIKIVRTSTIPMSLSILLKGQLKFLSNYFQIIGVSSPGHDLEEVSLRESILVREVAMERGISPLKDLVSLIRMVKVLKEEKPMVIHSITPKAGLISMIAGWVVGVPIRMHTFTGLIFPSKKGFLKHILILMDKVLCLAATNVYPEGNGVKSDLLKYNITSKRLKVLGNGNINGVDLSHFDSTLISSDEKNSLKAKYDISIDDFVYVFVGRLVGDKGVNELVSAFDNLVTNNRRLKLILIGEHESKLDPLSKKSYNTIVENDNIIEVGFQKDIRPFLSISDCLVFPSYREGFPNVVLQAGAMELPCIVSDINGSNEIIVDGVNGLIIPVKNESALEKTMKTVYESPELIKKLSSNARKIIVDKFDQNYVWNCIVEEYRRLINQKN